MSVSLSTNLADLSAVPYFLWDDPMTGAEFRQRLISGSPDERARLLGKLLREARDTDVWMFVTLGEVLDAWAAIAPHLGRRRAFWEFLLSHWRQEGLIGKE